MQNALEAFNVYCKKYGQQLNTEETKTMTFSLGKVRKVPHLSFNGWIIEVGWDYKYLRAGFNHNNKFSKVIKLWCALAKKTDVLTDKEM